MLSTLKHPPRKHVLWGRPGVVPHGRREQRVANDLAVLRHKVPRGRERARRRSGLGQDHAKGKFSRAHFFFSVPCHLVRSVYLEADAVGTAGGVVDGRGAAVDRDAPLVPDLFGRDAAPERDLDGGPGHDLHRRAQREKDGEPAKHAGRVRRRQDAQLDLLVQLGLEIAGDAVEEAVGRRLKGLDGESRVVWLARYARLFYFSYYAFT